MSFPYDQAEYEEVPCNLCDRKDAETLSTTGRGGVPVKTVICRFCGLIYISPRMSKEWYRKFYHTGYREETARMKEGESLAATAGGLVKIFSSGLKFGTGLGRQVGSFLGSGLTLEVGSSCGGVLVAFGHVRPDLEVLGIEPSPREATYAESRGVRTIVSLFEDLGDRLPKAANIIIARSLNHLLDPKAFFAWAHRWLEPQGRLVIAVQDFRLSAKKKGSLSQATQIDHTYMFTKETLENFIRAAGFEVLFSDTSERKSFHEWTEMRRAGLTDHMRFVVQNAKGAPFSDRAAVLPLYPEVRRSLGRLSILRYYLPFEWHRFCKSPRSWLNHRLRRFVKRSP